MSVFLQEVHLALEGEDLQEVTTLHLTHSTDSLCPAVSAVYFIYDVSVCLSVCQSVCLSVSLSVCLSVCLTTLLLSPCQVVAQSDLLSSCFSLMEQCTLFTAAAAASGGGGSEGSGHTGG